MPYLFDFVMIAILVLFFVLGWKKGLLLSLCGLAVVAVSFLAAGFLADSFDKPLADAIQPKLQAAIEKNVNEYMTTYHDGMDSDDALPDNVLNIWDGMRDMGGIYAWCADSVEDTINQFSRHLDLSEMFSIAANRVATQLAHHIIFAIAFILLTILLTLLLHALDLVAKLPGLHFCNGLGGGLIGLVKGVLVLWVAVVVLQFFPGKFFSQDTLEKSYLLPYFIVYNPILALFQ